MAIGKPFASNAFQRWLLVILLRFAKKQKRQAKLLWCSAVEKEADFGSRREPVLKGRHRSHYSSGFTTEGART
jgi:hypothetical protein